MERVIVNKDLCKGCGICIEFCPANVFERDIDGSSIPEFQERCTGCKLCVFRCPDFAIDLEVLE